ncbi:MAG: vWA domain-containing protein [Anaerolineae bacterium]
MFVLTGRPQRSPTLVALDVADDGTALATGALPLDLPLDDRALFGLSADGDTVLLCASGLVVSIDTASSPLREVGRVSLTHPAVGLFGAGGRAVAAGGGLSLIGYEDPAEMDVLAAQAWPAAWPEVRNAVAVRGDRVVAAQWDAGLSIAALGPHPVGRRGRRANRRRRRPRNRLRPRRRTRRPQPPARRPSRPRPPPTGAPPDATPSAIPPSATSAPSSTAAAPPGAPTAPASATAAPTATPRPSSTLRPRPTTTPRLSAAAGRGTSIFLPLVVTESCPPRDVFSDIVLVVDASTSMAERTATGQQKIDAALDAVWTFLDGLRLQGAGDRAAIVVFNDTAATLQGLTGDRRRLVSALRRVALAPRSRVDLGITAASAELIANGRAAAVQAIVVLSDGRANPVAPSAVVTAARAARQAGLALFVVGIGPDMDAPTLRAMAGAATRFFPAPDPDQLRPIYAALVRTVPCPASGYWSKR